MATRTEIGRWEFIDFGGLLIALGYAKDAITKAGGDPDLAYATSPTGFPEDGCVRLIEKADEDGDAVFDIEVSDNADD